MDEAGFKQFITSKLLENLMRDFPNETKVALNRVG